MVSTMGSLHASMFEIDMKVGRRIRALREAKGLSQGDLEKRCGLLRSYVSRVEGGHTLPSLPSLEKFALALEVEPYQLLFGEDAHPGAATLPVLPQVSRSSWRLLRAYDELSAPNRRFVASLMARLARG